jgi:general secretion pathway protein D
MRSWILLLVLSNTALAKAPTLVAAVEKQAEEPPSPPGEQAFLGCTKYPTNKKFRWGVRGEVGLPELVASLSEISCQPIVVGGNVAARAGKVSIEVPDLLSASEVYHLFFNALEALGLTVEKSGKVLKIVDAARGKEVAQPLKPGEATPAGDAFVIRLLHPAHARAQDVAEVIGRLKSKEGDVSVYAAGSAVMVTDHGENVRRMEDLLAAIDVDRARTDRLWALSTHAQTASELAGALEKILVAGRRAPDEGGKGAPAPGGQPLADGVTALVPVDGARTVVMVGSEPGFHRVAQLAARLDPAPIDDLGGQAHVIYLANTNADEMAQTLQQLGLGSRASMTSSPRPTGVATTGAPAASGPALQLQGDVRIAADKVSNAIVVFANGADFQTVRDLVQKLDVPRRQVFVEATILDLSIDKDRTLGVSLYGGQAVGNTGATLLGGLNAPLSGSQDGTIQLNAAALAGVLASGVGILGPSMNIAGSTLPSFGVMLQAVEHAKDVSVISRPHLLTMDNVKASLSVGQTFPYASSSLGAAGGVSNSLITTYARQDVSLKLDLTPHLNESDSVRLEIDGEISDVPDGQSTTNPGGPVTNKRTIKTAVVVKDGETIVLGGLQKEGSAESVQKVPFLGDIPLLGRLFQTRARQRVKQDLLIILTPYVVRGPEDLRRIHDRKDAERREFLERYSAFKDESVYDAHVDYRRKRGLLQEINVSAQNAETEAAALRAAESTLRKPPADGPID